MPKVRSRQPVIKSCDIESTGTDLRHGSQAFLVTIGYQDGNCKYWLWNVDPFTRQPEIIYEDLQEIQDELDTADIVVGQNFKFDVTGLQRLFCGNLRFDWSKLEDTLIASHLIHSGEPHDLTSTTLKYLHINIKPYEDRLEKATKEARRLIRTKAFIEKHGRWLWAEKGVEGLPSAKEEVWRADYWIPRAVALAEGYADDHPWWTVCLDYGITDPTVTLPLFLEQKRILEERGLWTIYRERMKLIPIAYKMENDGVTLSEARLNELTDDYKTRSTTCNSICTNIAAGYGHELVLPKAGNNKSLTEFIFKKMELPIAETTEKGDPSLNKVAMDVYQVTLPTLGKPLKFINTLRKKRSLDTAITYLEGYRRFWREYGGLFKLHPNLNITGTKTLRGSSNNPNGQNISKKEDFNLRYVFGPALGRVWYSLDYENIELRIPAYESGEKAMIEIFEKPDDAPYFGSYHLLNTSILYPEQFWPIAENKGEFKERYKSTYYQWVKNFDFAIGYGAMEISGTADRAAHMPGAQRRVADKLKEHSRLNQYWIDFANERGYVETLPDKTVCTERGYPLYCRKMYGKVIPTVPLNYHVQGTAMQCTNKAMIRVSEYLKGFPDHRMALQVHDEILLDFPELYDNGPIISKIKELMEESGNDIGIPLKVSISYHPDNWSEEGEIPDAQSSAA